MLISQTEYLEMEAEKDYLENVELVEACNVLAAVDKSDARENSPLDAALAEVELCQARLSKLIEDLRFAEVIQTDPNSKYIQLGDYFELEIDGYKKGFRMISYNSKMGAMHKIKHDNEFGVNIYMKISGTFTILTHQGVERKYAFRKIDKNTFDDLNDRDSSDDGSKFFSYIRSGAKSTKIDV